MSLPTYSIVCSACDFSCADDFPSTMFTYRVYDLGGVLAPVMHCKAWCPACSSVVNAEHVPTEAEIATELARFRYWLGEPERRAQRQAEWAAENPEKARASAEWAKARPATEKKPDTYRAATDELHRQFIAGESAWRAWAVSARGRVGRCLECLGPVQALAWVSPPPPVEPDDLFPHRPPELPPPNWVHPGCGGVMTRFDNRFRVAWREPERPEVKLLPLFA